ncbi:MAG: sigma-70 family RNA polymerase sigma factor [Deltaproteobacteria bacterium]|nr:sigma-70 family RNA polymerase sigma factor [Deltaproteobacteria bacterium]
MSDNELEFQKIYETFQPKIHRYLTRLVDEHEAEDLTQEVFTKVSQGLKNFRGESQLSTWIYRIATNIAFDRLRNPSFQQMVQKRLSSDSTAEDKISTENVVWTSERAPSIDQQLIRKEMNECIQNFIEELPENYRTVLVLSELDGLKNREIAEILQVSLGTVKIRLHRARAKLKKELEIHCSFYRDERNELACDLKSAFEEFQK